MACAVSASSQSPVQTKPSGEFLVLLLEQPIRFLNSDGLPSNIPSGTYQVTVPSPEMLQLTSTSTGKAQNLHATAITHTESLTAPDPPLIEETKKQGHVHMILLLPDGQGLNAEGRREQIQSRGIGDMKGFAFTPTRRDSWVIMQQGRVTMDADLNEEEAVSSSARTGLLSEVAPSYGQVTLDQGRIQLDAGARQSLHQICRFCAKNNRRKSTTSTYVRRFICHIVQ